MEQIPFEVISLVTLLQSILPADPAGHRAADLNYRGRNAEAHHNRVSQLGEPCHVQTFDFTHEGTGAQRAKGLHQGHRANKWKSWV